MYYIPTPISSNNTWAASLIWLHNANIKPSPFCQIIWLKTNKSSKNKVKSAYHKLLQIIILSQAPLNQIHVITYLHKLGVLWKLVFIFESIVLFPLENLNNDETATQIDRQLNLFHTGIIQKLYEASKNIVSRIPLEKSTKDKNLLT